MIGCEDVLKICSDGCEDDRKCLSVFILRSVCPWYSYRFYDGIVSSSWGRWDGCHFRSMALGKMQWMSNLYLQCQQEETLNVRLNSFVERRYV